MAAITPQSPGSSWRDHLLLVGRFLRSPRTVGAVAPSSRVLARAMVGPLDLEHGRLVELGPGTGAFTRAIVEGLGPAARFLALDIEPAFVEALRRRWPQIDVVLGSAEHLAGIAAERHMLPIDHIVSGLPFASLPVPVTRGILAGVEATLRTGGTFTTFQYVSAYRMRTAVNFRRELSTRLRAEPTRQLVLWNFPPAWVLTWTKR